MYVHSFSRLVHTPKMQFGTILLNKSVARINKDELSAEMMV